MPDHRQLRLGVHLSNHGSAAECVELGGLAAKVGLDSVWISEDLFFRGAMPIAAAIAATTTQIQIGFGVLTPQLRHAALLAMEAAALVDIAGPRIVLGVGAGVSARIKAIGVEAFSPLGAVNDVVEVLRGMLSGREVMRADGSQRAIGLRLSFADLPPAPPVYVAAVGPKALAQAGRIADGVVLSLMSSHRYTAWATDRIREGAAAAARDPDLPIVIYVPVAVAPNGAEAIASLKPLIAYHLQRWLPIESLAPLFTEWGPLPREEILAIGAQLEAGRTPEEVIPDELVLDYCIAGDLDQCRRQIELMSAVGVSDVVVDPSGDMQSRRSSIRMLGSLRAALAGSTAI